jgi:branched-chain amino acid aminotransferase
MPKDPINVIKVWEVSEVHGAMEISLPDMGSLDAITRQLSQGLYSTFRTYDNGRRVLGLRAHLRRLYQPATVQERGPCVSIQTLRQILAQTLREYPEETRVRLMMTTKGQVYLAVEPLKTPSAEVYARGVWVITSEVARQSPRLKSTAFITASADLRTQLAKSGAYEALLVRNGFILEGMTSNFFYVKNEKLGTARRDILLGVTRSTVLRVARARGVEIVYRPLKQEQIPSLSEAFLTSSSRGIVPIVRIDDVTVGEGRPGAISTMLRDQYEAYVESHAEKLV